jgi:nucleoid-associated protein YgaU
MWRNAEVGLFDFVKDVGAKLGIGSAEAAPAPEELKKEVEKLGLDAEDLDVAVEGDKVKVSGKVKDQATKEKLIVAMGNVQGVAQVDESIEAASAEPEAAMYTVQKGDTLWAIAKEHYGDGNKYPLVFEANKPMLTDPDKIYPGQTRL